MDQKSPSNRLLHNRPDISLSEEETEGKKLQNRQQLKTSLEKALQKKNAHVSNVVLSLTYP